MKEEGGQFTRGVHEHVHQPDANCDIVAQVGTAVWQNMENDPFESAAVIAEAAVNEAVEEGLPLPTLPSISNLSRLANRRREATRPQDPRGLDFQLQMEHIPEGFLKRDVTVGTHRHLIFATATQASHTNTNIIAVLTASIQFNKNCLWCDIKHYQVVKISALNSMWKIPNS